MNHGRYCKWRDSMFDRERQADGAPWWEVQGRPAALRDVRRNELEWLSDLVELIEYLTFVCENAKTELWRFSQRQVGDGFWYLLLHGGYYVSVLRNPLESHRSRWKAFPTQEQRLRCIRSTYHLFVDYIGPKVAQEGHDASMGNLVEWWWEYFPVPDPMFVGEDYDAMEPVYSEGDDGVPPKPEDVAASQAYYDEVLGVMGRLLEKRDPAYFYDVRSKLFEWREPTGKARRLETEFSKTKGP